MKQRALLKFTGERMIPKLNIGETFYYEHITRYFFASQFVKNKNVLDLGCGSGYGCYILKNVAHSSSTMGIDISPEAIKYAKENYGDYINFFEGDIRHLDNIKNNTIDVVTCFEVIEHVKEQQQILKEVKRVLKKNGLLIISTPNTINYTKGNKFHLKELTPTELRNILKDIFKNTQILFQNFLFSNEIFNDTVKKKVNIRSMQNFTVQNQLNYSVPKNTNNSEYLIAICSESQIPKYDHLSLTTDKVGSLTMEKGMISLSKQFSEIYTINQQNAHNVSLKDTEISKLQHQLSEYRNDLNFIYHSKIWKLFSVYKKLRPIVKSIIIKK